MNMVPALPAVLAALALFVLPGLLFLALLPREARAELRLDERLFLIVAASAAVAAWLALLLAELGRFSLVVAGVVAASVCALVALVFVRRLQAPLARPRSLRDWLPAALLLAVTLALQARPTEYLFGGRDPGTYIAAMATIGRTGAIVWTDPTVLSIPAPYVDLFYRHPDKPGDFEWGRFMGFPLERPETGRVVPEFFHLFPAFGAYLFQALGVKGALATPPVFGVLATLAVFFALRVWLGGRVALLAASLLTLDVLQIWFARFPVSEMVSQWLTFLGLLALLRYEGGRVPHWAALGGFAFGLSLLVRIDSLLLVVPVVAYLALRHAQGRLPRSGLLAFAVPFGLLSVHALTHALLFSRKYVLSIVSRPYWQQPSAAWIVGALALLALAILFRYLAPRVLSTLERRRENLLLVASCAVVVLALYAACVRPTLSAWAGADGNPEQAQTTLPWLASWLQAAGFQRLAAHDASAFLRFAWFVTPVGLTLAVLGLVRRLRAQQSSDLLPILLTLSFALFYFYKMRVWNDYFFAMRRMIPVVLPMALAFAAVVIVGLLEQAGLRRKAGVLLALFLGTAFAHQSWPLRAYTDWLGAVNFTEELARRFTRDDVVIFEQPRSIHLLALPLWAAHGLNVLELARFNPDPARLNELLRRWGGRYRNIYFVHTYSTDLCGVFLERVADYEFGTLEFERTYDRAPRRPEFRALRFTVSRVTLPEDLQVPALPSLDIGGSDDFQVSGFFDKEGGGDLTYRWTGRCASVYLPGARPGAELRIRAGVGQRPPEPAARVRASLTGQSLGEFTVLGGAWNSYTLRLPDPLPSGAPVLRFDLPDWRPNKVLAGSTDPRDLGMMVDRIEVLTSAKAPVTRDR